MKAWRFEVASFEADTFDLWYWDTKVGTFHWDEILLLKKEIDEDFRNSYLDPIGSNINNNK